MSDVEPLVDLAGAAAFLSMTEKQVRKLIERAPGNGFPVRHAGRLLRFKLSELDAWTGRPPEVPGPAELPASSRVSGRPAGRPSFARGPRERAPRGSLSSLTR